VEGLSKPSIVIKVHKIPSGFREWLPTFSDGDTISAQHHLDIFSEVSILVPHEISMSMCVSISSPHISWGRPNNGTIISLPKQLPLGKCFVASS
jgi:hypothetical protein